MIPCPKCGGTGTVSRFLDYKGGVCFDCNGAGEVADVVAPSRVRARLRRDAARRVGQAVAAGEAVPADVRAEALAYFEALGPASWGEADYAARNALAL